MLRPVAKVEDLRNSDVYLLPWNEDQKIFTYFIA